MHFSDSDCVRRTCFYDDVVFSNSTNDASLKCIEHLFIRPSLNKLTSSVPITLQYITLFFKCGLGRKLQKTAMVQCLANMSKRVSLQFMADYWQWRSQSDVARLFRTLGLATAGHRQWLDMTDGCLADWWTTEFGYNGRCSNFRQKKSDANVPPAQWPVTPSLFAQ